jgi:methionine-S-sulfoxide reductase
MKFFSFLVALLLAGSFVARSVHAQVDPSPAAPGLKTAIFAGGCFWCTQYAFDRAPGVKKTVVGYTGGKQAKPDYESVSSGATGHAESITVYYDPGATTYEKLLDVFWKNIDPTQVDGQFADKGTQYRTAIFYQNDEEKQAAEKSLTALAKSGKFDRPIATRIVPASAFFAAEDHHQEYYKKNPEHFHAYEAGSGRVRFFQEKWGADASKP